MIATLFAALAAALTACATSSPSPQPIQTSSRRPLPQSGEFRISDLAKSDIDAVAESHLDESLASVRTLMEKLYRRNPRELKKSGQPTIDAAIARAFVPARDVTPAQRWRFAELNDVRGVDALQLAFRADYAGDRVFAFSVGLASMIHQAYGYQTEFFLFDTLDPQALYNAARNVEIAAWKLGTARDARGELLLLSNDITGDARNLSFEREFGKLIGYQDLLARVIAQQSNRTIRRVVHNVATGVFLPIPVK